MVPAGDTPKATRRRLRAFVVAALVVLAVVSFWPIRGYRVDDEKFVEALGFPYLRADEYWVFDDDLPGGTYRAYFFTWWHETSRKSWKMSDEWERELGHYPTFERMSGLGAPAFRRREHGDLVGCIRCRNIVCFFRVVPNPESGAKTVDEIARECVAAVLEGIDGEIPGVTPFYNPPARQFWIDRGKSSIEKVKRHFRKMFAP